MKHFLSSASSPSQAGADKRRSVLKAPFRSQIAADLFPPMPANSLPMHRAPLEPIKLSYALLDKLVAGISGVLFVIGLILCLWV